jgi:hypothetical protein
MKKIAFVIASLAMIVALWGCVGSAPDSPYPHTVNNGGVMHGEGIADPLANCTECHGANLEGTDTTPSCTDCHEQRW